MKLIKKAFIIISAVVLIMVLIPISTKAAERKTEKELVKSINKQLSTAENITTIAYLGKISKNTYLSTVAINTKQNILYADWYTLGRDKFYIYKNKMYTYNNTEKKWKSEKLSMASRRWKCDYTIYSESAKKFLGSRKFDGKSCYALRVKYEGTNIVYYVNKSNNRLIGIISASGSKKVYMKVDTNKTVYVPSYVLKGKKINCDTNVKEDIKVTAVYIHGKIDDIKITSYSELTKLINQIKSSNEYEENKERMSSVVEKLESYDKTFFKKKALYLKNYLHGCPQDIFAVKKYSSSGKISITLAYYYMGDVAYPAIGQQYIIFTEADKNAASSIRNVKVKFDPKVYFVPNIR